MSQAERGAGNIYDLGYRRYEGERLGRRHAVLALYLYTLRTAFGMGRRASAKVIPVILTIIIMLPALIQLGIAAIAPRDIEVIKPEGYFGFVQVIVALFCAAVAPELAGRDQRNRTLSLYFSRALLRSDYALAKLAGLATAIFAINIAPQIVLFIGSALAQEDSWQYTRDHWDEVAPIVGSAIAVSLFMGGVAMAIASQTPRRAFSTGGILAFFVVLHGTGGALFNTTSGELQRYLILVDPFALMEGLIRWLFRVAPDPASPLATADLPGVLHLAAILALTAAAAFIVVRRYQRIPA